MSFVINVFGYILLSLQLILIVCQVVSTLPELVLGRPRKGDDMGLEILGISMLIGPFSGLLTPHYWICWALGVGSLTLYFVYFANLCTHRSPSNPGLIGLTIPLVLIPLFSVVSIGLHFLIVLLVIGVQKF